MSDGELFNVVQFLDAGKDGGEQITDYVRRNVPAEEAVKAARHYTQNVAAIVLGVTARVIITDQDDNCVFEWKRGEGITFPPEAKGRM